MPANVPDFERLFRARAIAVVGASANPVVVGGQPLRYLTEFGYTGKVYPVNPKYDELRGLACYQDVRSVPRPCDLALIAVSGTHVPAVLEQCEEAGIPFAVVISAGFREIGERGMENERRLGEVLSRSRIRIVGPNCIGILNTVDRMHAGFGSAMNNPDLRAGGLAMITQSGGYGMGVVSLAHQAGLGFSYVVSTGNETSITATELMAYALERNDVQGVVGFLEGTTDGRALLRIGERALELGKPVFLWKVGNSRAGQRAATSHTGRLTAGPELFRRAMREGGFIEISDTDDLIDISRFMRYAKRAAGRRVAILTLSGGAGVLMADLCEQNGLEVPPTTEATMARLRPHAPDFAALGNPLDFTPQGYADNFASYNRVVEEALAAPEFDQIILRSAPGKPAAIWAQRFVEIARGSPKPIAVTMGSGSENSPEALRMLEASAIPCFVSPRRAINALGAWCAFSDKLNRHAVRSTMPDLERALALPAELPPGGGALGEHRSKRILATAGIPVVREVLLTEAELGELVNAPLPFPVAVKVESADIPHKTEAGAVRLGVRSIDELRAAARDVLASARRHAPQARIDGVLVQEMASGIEAIAGAVVDPHFGPTVMFGLGGVLAEVMQDVTHRFAPFDTQTALAMVREIRGVKLLDGWRGAPACDIPALADALSRLSHLIAACESRIVEIDVNPLFVRPAGQGVVAADALIVLREGPSA